MQSLRMGNTISLILYVGDILLAGNDVTLLQEIKRLLSQNSDTKDMGEFFYVEHRKSPR
jgi:hypothetical protein